MDKEYINQFLSIFPGEDNMDKERINQFLSILQGIEAVMFYNALTSNGQYDLNKDRLESDDTRRTLYALKRFGSDLADYLTQLISDGDFDYGEEQKEED